MIDDFNFCGNAYTRSACENWSTLCRKFGNLKFEQNKLVHTMHAVLNTRKQ